MPNRTELLIAKFIQYRKVYEYVGGAEISRQELLDCLDSLSAIMAKSDIPQKKETIEELEPFLFEKRKNCYAMDFDALGTVLHDFLIDFLPGIFSCERGRTLVQKYMPGKLICDASEVELDKQSYKYLYETLKDKYNCLERDFHSQRFDYEDCQRELASLNADLQNLKESGSMYADSTKSLMQFISRLLHEDGDVIEGSTNNLDTKTDTKRTAVPDALVGSTVAAENSQKRLGTTSEVSMFSDTEINTIPGTQYATGKVIRFAESNPIVKFSDTNGKEINDITDESLENIYKIFNYYANHLEELGNLGSDEVINAAHDESKAVILSLAGAGDIKPNVTQETAFRNNRSAILNLKFPNITTGALYLVVHERADQAGQYEVCLTTATDNSLSLNVSSLSPVAVAKVEIKDATAVVNSTYTEDVEAMNTEKPAETNTGGFRVVMTILIVLMLLVSVGIVVILKLKREGKLPQFLSFLYN